MLYGTVAEHIYASRFLSGLAGGGIQTAMTYYIAEISDDSIRGMLGTSYQLSRCFGILFAYILEVYINYIQLSVIMIVLTLLYAITFVLVPPTPQYLLKIGAEEVCNLQCVRLIFNVQLHFIEIYVFRERGKRSNFILVLKKKLKNSIWHFSDCRSFRKSRKKIQISHGKMFVSI